MFGAEGFDFVLAHVDIDFRNEVTQDDGEVTVRGRVAGYGRSSVRTREVVLKSDGTLAAESGAVSVPRDETTGNSRPLTDAERAILDAAIRSRPQSRPRLLSLAEGLPGVVDESCGSALVQLVADDEPLDFAGAFPDAVDAQFAVQPLNGDVAHVPTATVDLNCVVDDSTSSL